MVITSILGYYRHCHHHHHHYHHHHDDNNDHHHHDHHHRTHNTLSATAFLSKGPFTQVIFASIFLLLMHAIKWIDLRMY